MNDAVSSTGATEDQARSAEPRSNRIGIGKIVALSLGVGLAAAVLLPFIPWPTVDANFATAMVLFGFAVGWALLAALSVQWTDQPQRWAYAPALFMGVSAVLLLVLPDAVWARSTGSGRRHCSSWWPGSFATPSGICGAGPALGCSTRCLRCSYCSRWVARTRPSAARWNPRRHARRTRRRRRVPAPSGVHRHGRPDRHPRGRRRGVVGDLRLDAPDVARHTTVCVYDRAGKGWSDAAQTAPDGAQIATDLHTLLERADVAGPYVLAGHSFGGLYVMRYAAQYPDEVAGMVLINSTAPNATPVSPTTEGSDSLLKHFSALMSATARLGLGRLLGATANEMAAFIDEYAVAGRSASEAGELTSLDGKPLIVLTAEQGNAPGLDAAPGRDGGALDQQPSQRRARSNPSVPRRQPDPRRRRQRSDRRRRRGDTDRSATRDSVGTSPS